MGLFQYVKDTRSEMRHVAWPTQTQTAIFTVAVIVVSLITAFYLGAFDFLFTEGLQGLLNITADPSTQPVTPVSVDESALPEGVDIEFSATGVGESGAEITTEPAVAPEVE